MRSGRLNDRWFSATTLRVLYRAKKLGVKIAEVPVVWRNSAPTKVSPIKSSLDNVQARSTGEVPLVSISPRKTKPTEVLVVMPTYNESQNLEKVVAGVRHFGHDVLVVDDSSPDGNR